MNRYGFIREVECDLLDELIPQIKREFGFLSWLEIGVMGGSTATGVVRRCREIDCPVSRAAGVDILPWHSVNPIPEYVYYEADSMDAWRNIPPGFNLLFIDGCHCVNHCMCDFLNFSPLLDVGGYCLFHDSALPTGGTKQDAYPQDHSYAGKPPSVLGVREGLTKLGLLDNRRTDWQFVREITSSDGTGGMMLFRKVKELQCH